MTDYTVIIGLEVHVQLLTKTKIFCGCSTAFNPDHPNTQTCPVCLGLPGSLPVMNREAFELALKTALALHCNIAPFTKWDRKQYYYPDLPKGYQISQYDLPFSFDGFLDVPLGPESGEVRRVRIIRAHMEEDAGKNTHDESGRGKDSQVDLNRAGTPLVEIVSQPDLRTPLEARLYLEELRLLLTYLNVSDCNMQEGSLRCDANVNLHIHEGEERIATPIVEIKNLNSFRFLEMALEYEVQRQLEEWNTTRKRLGDVPKETRGYDSIKNVTTAQRGKEEASDYRYFPDPDLVPVIISEEKLEQIREAQGELPAKKRDRFQASYGLSNYDARVLVEQGDQFSSYFESVAEGCGDGKQACNWVTQDVLRELNDRKLTIEEFPIRPDLLVDLLKRCNARSITLKSARDIFLTLLNDFPANPINCARIDEIISQKGLAMVSDTGALEEIISGVLAVSEKAINDFKSGKQAAIGALIGQVMKKSRGADPNTVRELLIAKINQT